MSDPDGENGRPPPGTGQAPPQSNGNVSHSNGDLAHTGGDLTHGNGVDHPPSYEDSQISPTAQNGKGSDKPNQSSTNVKVTVTDEEGKKKDDDTPENMVGWCDMFRFADGLDAILMILGSLAALCHGAGLPAMIIVFGEMINTFVDSGNACDLCSLCFNSTGPPTNSCYSTFSDALQREIGHSCSEVLSDTTLLNSIPRSIWEQAQNVTGQPFVDPTSEILKEMSTFAIYYVIIGVGVMVCAYLQVGFWSLAALRQSHRIRLLFLKSITRQDMGWFDCTKPGELSSRLADDINKIQDGMGGQAGGALQMISACIAGFVIGFVYGWKLTLVILAASPLLMFAAAIMAKSMAAATAGELKAYAKAGAVAEEVLSAIRTVVSFNGQWKECERYNENLAEARSLGVKKGVYNGMGLGFVMFVVYAAYALGFWYGTRLVLAGEPGFGVGNMIIVFFCVLIGAFSLGNAGPFVKTYATARGAAYIVFDIIARDPPIDSSSPKGETLPEVRGDICLRNVQFEYPSRPDVPVLRGLDVTIKSGKTVALVGASGCGKSTVIQLIQRFYDPSEGAVELDGKDIRDFNISWLRGQIGIVSQEPILFATTIRENIKYGRNDVTEEEMIQATKESNAYDFIMQFPETFDTLVGERGAQMSGGQKQRIAIARALVNKPKILLLDEATSALDTESEATVQAALDKAREGRTTIVIAHRLSTIQTADEIVGVENGRVAEHGTHEELMKLGGVYFNLVTNQQRKSDKKKTGDEDGDEETDEEELAAEEAAASSSGKPGLDRLVSVHSARERALSISSNASKPPGDEEEKPEEKKVEVGFFELLGWNAPEWPYILLGCFGALLNGGTQPAFAIIMSKILAIFQGCDAAQTERDANLYSLLFLVLAFAILLASLIQSASFGLSGENLTMRIRQQTFKALLRQEISYFDDPSNSTGALTTRLSTEASSIQGATGVRLGAGFQALANMGTAIVIAFIYSWQLTLLILAFVPIIGIAGFVEMKLMTGGHEKDKESYEGAGKVATECISNIRTVQALRQEATFNRLYEDTIKEPHAKELRMTQAIGVVFGVSQCIIYFAYAACFTLGAFLIEEKEINFEQMMITFSVVIFGAMALGQATAFVPDAQKGVDAAGHIKAIHEKVPAIDIYSTEGEQPSTYEADIEFNKVSFAYATRASVKVLKEFSVRVKPGQRIALVGSSGCGKSTSVSLLERFYDPIAGNVLLGNRDLCSLNLQWLRQQIGLVSQEPILFDRSIQDNIAYGDNTRTVTLDEIIEAARSANIHEFISQLPAGYDTRVGDKGTQLSGGQKQRIAIARALIRNPRILLLDEATSALDTESEKVVQEALDKAQIGRTSLVIAHRLSTVQDADLIVVIQKGRVTEMGTHSELMEKGGFYRKLQNIQTSH